MNTMVPKQPVFYSSLDEPETTDISLQQLIQQNYNLLDEDDGLSKKKKLTAM